MNRVQRVIGNLLVALGVMAVAATAAADIINVPGDQPTIQAGIDAAVDGDEVVVAPDTYMESITFNGKAITVRSTDPTDAAVVVSTIIDGTGFFHVVQCVSGEGADTVLSGFVITGGTADGVGLPDNRGGGMLNIGSSPTVTNCTFSVNTADVGGGMFSFDGSPTVSNCTFSGNTANQFGGGMSNGIFSNSTVTNCTFSGNVAQFGGGMANITINPAVSNSTFSANTANESGGGMSNGNSSNSTVTDCMFSGNTARFEGGGMLNIGSSPTVTNCTFSVNTAIAGGGGMSNADSSPTVSDSIVCANTPDQIDGAFIDGSGNIIGPYCPPPPAACEGDLNGDGVVDIVDLLAVLSAWGMCQAD